MARLNAGFLQAGGPEEPTQMSGTSRQQLVIANANALQSRRLASVLGEAYQHRFASTGQDVLRMAIDNQADLILIAVRLPDTDGFAICRQLKADPRTHAIPVILTTEHRDGRDESEAFRAGAVDYLMPPFRAEGLQARVRTHLELRKAHDELLQLAAIDPLTGIANRRSFDLWLENEWRRSRRAGRILSLGLFDVDFFKQFNDSYGHPRGDESLRQLAATLRGVFRRPGDLVARIGGEEFAVVLPDTDFAGTLHVTRKMVRQIRNLCIEHRASEASAYFSVSGGLLTLRPRFGEEASEGIEKADQLLYQAKRTGRNRCLSLNRESGEQQTVTAPPA